MMTQENIFSLTASDIANEKPIVLIAEDDRLTRTMIAQILESDGYQIIEVINGNDCLAAYQEAHPSLVILDAMMPIMNGFECCKQLMQLPGSAYTPILMITGLEDETSVNWAFDSGVSDFITKPIHWPVLRRRVRIQIEKNQLYKRLEQANQKLSQLASIDALTQLANRRVFSEQLQKEWQRMARDKSHLSLIFADIDYFKIYNDTYGHVQGDRCLIQVAQAMKFCVKRPADLIARYGGEEFTVLLPSTPLAGAVHVAEQIRRPVKALAIPNQHSSISDHITISLGVACVVPSSQLMGAEILLQAADNALYQAKAEGRESGVCGYFPWVILKLLL